MKWANFLKFGKTCARKDRHLNRLVSTTEIESINKSFKTKLKAQISSESYIKVITYHGQVEFISDTEYISRVFQI